MASEAVDEQTLLRFVSIWQARVWPGPGPGHGTHQLGIQLYHLATKYLQLVPLNLSSDRARSTRCTRCT